MLPADWSIYTSHDPFALQFLWWKMLWNRLYQYAVSLKGVYYQDSNHSITHAVIQPTTDLLTTVDTHTVITCIHYVSHAGYQVPWGCVSGSSSIVTNWRSSFSLGSTRCVSSFPLLCVCACVWAKQQIKGSHCKGILQSQKGLYTPEGIVQLMLNCSDFRS